MIEGRTGKKGKMGDDKKIKERLGNGKGREGNVMKMKKGEKGNEGKKEQEKQKRHLIKSNVLSVEANEKTETKI
jgi:hypothetical protein